MTSLGELQQMVLATFEDARSALATIEDAAQRESRPALHTLSHAYARMLAPLRDYMTAAQMGRALPRQLARRLSEHMDAFMELEPEIRALSLRPDLETLGALVRAAETAT